MEPATLRDYHLLAETAGPISLYSNPWWLEATCGKSNWNALIAYDDKQRPFAALPYHQSRIRSLSAITTPPLTQWVRMITTPNYINQNPVTFSGLPKSSILDLSVKPDENMHQQFDEFTPTLKYSFIIPYGSDIQNVRTKYNEGLRRNLKQAAQLHTIEGSDHLTAFVNLCQQTYEDRQMKAPPWLENVLPRVYTSLVQHQCGKLSVATSNGKVIAGILTAWDSETTYYLAGGKVSGDHSTAAHALLLDHAILESCSRSTSFDFEGSMHPGIANFFQSFGAIPVSYWHFRKYRGIGRVWAALKI
jgi:hypothetical protein